MTDEALSMTLPETVRMSIDQIKPYWRNPRRIPREAVEAVGSSIERYGYVQPIVVDRNHVVIVGHTRLEAMKELGITEAEVYVSDLPEEKAREYRLIDNRTGEMSGWDQASLVIELREFDKALLTQYFPDVNLEIAQVKATSVTEQEIQWADDAAKTIPAENVHLTTKVVCPSCFYSFEVRTESLPGVTRGDMERLKAEHDNGGQQ